MDNEIHSHSSYGCSLALGARKWGESGFGVPTNDPEEY